MPKVSGKQVSVATTTLKASSLNCQVIGKGDKVVKQVPESGAAIPKDGVVWLYTDDSELKMTTVPDFADKSLSQVNQLAKNAGINVVVVGINTSGGVAKVSKQSVEAGTQVAKGSVITVRFAYENNI